MTGARFFVRYLGGISLIMGIVETYTVACVDAELNAFEQESV